MKKYEFIVKYGFDDKDKVIIDETELEKALYIHKYNDVAVLAGKQITGRNIIVIEPYRVITISKVTVDGEEKEIERCEYERLNKGFDLLRKTREKIDMMIRSGKTNLIGKNVALPEFPQDEIKELE